MVTATTTEGAEVYRELTAAQARAKAGLGECRQEADRLDARMRELLAQRGEAVLKLANHYLPAMSRPAIEATFDGIRADLLAILARREARRAELKGQVDQGATESRRVNGEIDAVTARLNEKVALREKLEAQVAATLKVNADFQERSKLALQAEEKLHRDEGRVAEMERESAEKLPHYNRSRLFRYLYDRGYGTPEYKATGWVKSMDRHVADLIDFPAARNGYEFLKKAHELVAAEVARRREQFEELMRQVEAIEKAEADKVGLIAVLAEGDALGTERDRLVKEADRLQREDRKLQQGLAELDRAQDEFYRQAIDRFRSFLGETKLAVLQRKASQTPEPVDDEIVADIARLDEQINPIKPELAELTNRRELAERVQKGLDLVTRKYRQANYDSDRSYLPSFDARNEIARVEAGSASADDLWRTIQQCQKFRPGWIEGTTSNGMQVAASPAGRVILGALVEIAGAAMRDSAYRGVGRRSSINFPTFPSGGGGGWSGGGSSSGSEGGFTNGEGF
jgi:hypothetical protein